MIRSVRSIAFSGLLALISSPSIAALQFTDWTSADNATGIAVGNIGALTVTLSGTSVTEGVFSSSLFNSANFAPPLATSDWINISGLPSASYSVTFSQSVMDPVLHFASMASTLVFEGSSPVRLSGDATFVVTGNTVSGTAIGSSDSNGTIRLPGAYTSIAFTALFDSRGDGIAIQVGVDPSPLAVPEPSSYALMIFGLAAVVMGARRRSVRNAART